MFVLSKYTAKTGEDSQGTLSYVKWPLIVYSFSTFVLVVMLSPPREDKGNIEVSRFQKISELWSSSKRNSGVILKF